jgi:glycosylphosphatidylinositol transamidase (GPIT) subunit GPI8
MLFVATNSLDDIACIVGETRRRGGKTQLYFSDGAAHPSLPAKLGAAGEGLEGTALGSEPDTGFREGYQAAFGQLPPPFAAQAYDALALVAYALQRSGGQGGDPLAAALTEVLRATGTKTGWDAAGIADALKRLKAGELPDLSGATGPLQFDDLKGTDPVQSTYRLWRIENGAFVTTEFWSTKGSEHASSSDSALRSQASQVLESSLASGQADAAPLDRGHLWAVVAALSNGWENYRHQADALGIYQLLKAAGVPDDHIILILQDDLAKDPENAEPGIVRNVAGGPNLRDGIDIDYRLSDVGPDDVLAILDGRKTAQTPEVLASGPEDDVLVYLVGHGSGQGVYVAAGDATGEGATGFIDATSLARALDARRSAKGYRRMLLVVEACQSGTLGPGVTVPGALLMTAASATENSFSTNWDPAEHLWRADQFSWSLYSALRNNPAQSVADLYKALYRAVAGSHVAAFNARVFGNSSAVPASDFATP